MSRTKIRSDSPTPIRSQLKELLMTEIREGRFQAGGRIPSERELAERYGISRASVRESITELINSGILFRTVGKGTFVASDVAAQQPQKISTEPHNIAFVISDNIFHFVQTGYNKIFEGVQEVCAQQGWRLLFHTVGEDSSSPGLKSLRNKGSLALDGCVVVGGVRRHILDLLNEEGIPTVLVDLLITDEAPETMAVTIRYAEGAKTAVRYLFELGHRSIGYIGFSGSEKYHGYWSSLEELNLRYDPRQVEFLQLLDLQPGMLAGYHAMQRMLKAGHLPTALLVTNDFVAIGVMEALAIAGVRVPDQISIVGFDDLGQKTSPALTTVRVDLREVGRSAADAVRRKMLGEPLTEPISVPAELVVRDTTAPVRNPVLTGQE
ncbi:MAG TPA: GntR family transcriptional regulator [Bryobacteraceae bacterium]|nr:GntR family transcriptional regulator [Bryobacteraceae bacterium]